MVDASQSDLVVWKLQLFGDRAQDFPYLARRTFL